MTIASIRQGWDRFWFTPVRPVSMALCRITFGLAVLWFGVLLAPDLAMYYGEHGALSTLQGIPLLAGFLGQPTVLWPLYGVFMLAALCLTAGLWFRASAMAVFVGLCLLDGRDPIVMHGGDCLMRLLAAYVMLSDGGRALSLDRLRALARGEEGLALVPRPICVQRLVAVQMSMVYAFAFWCKIQGPTWIDGTAVYYVARLTGMRHFAVPYLFEHLWTIKLVSWGTLAFELAMTTLVWVDELTAPLLLIGVLFHGALDFSLVIPTFQWTMLSAYPAWLAPTAVERWWARWRTRLPRRAPLEVHFNEACAEARAAVAVAQALDWTGCLTVVPVATGELEVVTSKGTVSGREAMAALWRSLPLGRLGAMMLKLPECSPMMGS